MTDFNAWKIIAYVEIFYYFVAGILAAHLVYRLFKHQYSFKKLCFYIIILILFKIVAGICCVVLLSGKSTNVGLAIAFIIMNTIALGFFLRVLMYLLKFINEIHEEEIYIEGEEEEEKEYQESEQQRSFGIIGFLIKSISKPLPKKPKGKKSAYELPLLENLLGKVVLLGILLCSVGGGITSSNSTNTSTSGKKILEAGSILYLVALIGMMIVLCHKLNVYHHSVDKKHRIGTILILQLVMIPLILVRVVYSICSAFSFTAYIGSSASKFSLLYGEWSIYVGMSFIEECLVVLLIIITGELVVNRIR